MMPSRSALRLASASTLLLAAVAARPIEPVPPSPAIDPALWAGLSWRNIGPFRGGRIASVSGAIGQPGVFYAGLPAGGILKTTSAGETWFPVFDAVKEVSSVGAIEVAPSDPDVVYAGTGDIVTGGAINEGDGVWRSRDAGRTWQHVGLPDSRQIPSLLIDTHDPNVVLVAAQGDLHAKSQARGVFRTTDGGATWTRTLFVNDSTGMQKLARATDMPNVVYATSVSHYIAPPSVPGAAAPGSGAPTTGAPTGTSLFKSVDGGITWREVTGGGLPALAGRTSIAVANGTAAQRVFLISNTGLFRSDDGGASWRQMAADDERIRNGQGGYNCGVYVDPQHPDVVYTINTSSYKSVDGGRTFTGFKGAPGGDDPQQLWIDPTNGQRMLLGLDQGAVVTLDGGATWSSWYNQSNEQIYHLSIDNSFPYWIYGTQQDAGAIRTRARGNLGAVTPFDWNPVPGWEWGTIVADPLDPNVVYSSGSGILRIAYPSEQWISVSPAADPAAKLRTTISQPIIFAPWNRHQLLAAFQSVQSTTDGGAHWTALSGDLTALPGPVDSTARPAAIEALSASPVPSGAGTIWAGTNNGVIKVTRNGGKTWEDASIPAIPNRSRAEVLCVEPSPHDAATAYAVLDLHRIGDYAPYVFRTRDYGRTWTRIVAGLPVGQPSGSFARVVRSDPVKRGLLFAGTESGMFVSFDEGTQWQPLSLDLPTTSVRDIAIKGNDLVIATYGRGLFVLDDYSMLRQLGPASAGEAVHLFAPGEAVRLRRNVGADTPLPPEVPHAVNPPTGVVLDYWLAQRADSVSIDVLDATGTVVRHLSSAPVAPVPEAARPPEPNFWLATPTPLAATAGMHRATWDLRHDAPPAFRHTFEINANPGETPASPEGAIVLPGRYTLRLTANGRRSEQAVVVRPDPRSPATPAALRAQHDLLVRISDGLRVSYAGHQAAIALQSALRAIPADATPEMTALAARASALAARLDTVAGLDAGRSRARPARPAAPSFTAINNALVSQLEAQDNGDFAPTPAALAAYSATCRELATVLAAWEGLSTRDLVDFNTALTARGRPAIVRPATAIRAPACS